MVLIPSSKPSVAPVPEHPAPSSGLSKHSNHVAHITIQVNTHAHKKLLLKIKFTPGMSLLYSIFIYVSLEKNNEFWISTSSIFLNLSVLL